MPAPPESFYRRQPREREDEVTDAKSVKLFIVREPAAGKGAGPVRRRDPALRQRRGETKKSRAPAKHVASNAHEQKRVGPASRGGRFVPPGEEMTGDRRERSAGRGEPDPPSTGPQGAEAVARGSRCRVDGPPNGIAMRQAGAHDRPAKEGRPTEWYHDQPGRCQLPRLSRSSPTWAFRAREREPRPMIAALLPSPTAKPWEREPRGKILDPGELPLAHEVRAGKGAAPRGEPPNCPRPRSGRGCRRSRRVRASPRSARARAVVQRLRFLRMLEALTPTLSHLRLRRAGEGAARRDRACSPSPARSVGEGGDPRKWGG